MIEAIRLIIDGCVNFCRGSSQLAHASLVRPKAALECGSWLPLCLLRFARRLRRYSPRASHNRIFGFLAFATAVSFLPAPIFAQQTAPRSPRAVALGKRVKCMCGGCNDAAGSCYHSGGTFSGPCNTALGMLKEIDERVGRKESDDTILKSFVQEYGPLVLIEPPKSGFNLTAWIMPVAMPLLALGLLYGILRRWQQPRPGMPVTAPSVPPETLARVQREAERDDL